MKRYPTVLAMLLTLALLAACAGQQGGGEHGGLLGKLGHKGGASSEPKVGETEVRYGRIDRIDPVSLEGDHQLGMGHILGAVGGGVLGHQFGGGKGKMVAQVLGSLGGGYLGGQIQNKYVDRRPGQHITVTLNNGVAVGVTQPAAEGLRVGDCVRIDGSGQSARVVRASCAGPAVRDPRFEPGAVAPPQSLRARVESRLKEASVPGVPQSGAARPVGESAVRFGYIASIESVPLAGEFDLGLHHVMNRPAGESFGYQLPGGDGRAFADVANSLSQPGTAAADRPYPQAREGQYITVKLDNGVIVGIGQPPNATLRVGDRVRIEGSGPSARVARV